MDRTVKTISHFFEGLGVSLGRLKLVESRHGARRRIRLFRHPELGNVFVLGNEIQHVEAWAPLYHEPLVHLAAAFVPEVKDVLILGGGTLFAAAEALKYRSVRKVILVDHDPEVTKTVARYYRHAKQCLRDERFQLLTRDAYDGGATLGAKFDLVLNDGIDLLEVNHCQKSKHVLRDIFSELRDLLAPGGVCADVIQRHLFERHRIIQTINRLQGRARVALSLVLLPEYHGVLHVLSLWGRDTSLVSQHATRPINKEQAGWMRYPTRSPCTYYAPGFLPYYLHLPRYARAALAPRKRAP
jgi:spermidine synthase